MVGKHIVCMKLKQTGCSRGGPFACFGVFTIGYII